MNSPQIFDHTNCRLGEGAFWHPLRAQLFWFDILAKRLLTRQRGQTITWQFEEHISAAGWIDGDGLLVASETGLWAFDIKSGLRKLVVPLEADNPLTRSNDGRADRQGGFWISTMGKSSQAGVGAIYRFYRGELRKLYGGITIPNAICFSPEGEYAYFTDTITRLIMRQKLDQEGWPIGDPIIFIDLSVKGLNPDGAVIDAAGCIWNAQWGASRIARYAPDGELISTVSLPAVQVSSPCLGGPNLSTLYVTSATEGLDVAEETDGMTFFVETEAHGQAEVPIVLS